MEIFLKNVAAQVLEKNKSDLSDVCMVFPNRRSGIFFSRYLSEKIKAPVWPPEVKTINEFAESLTKLELADRLSMIFRLFEEFKKVIKSSGDLDEFYFWGEMLLNDFDNIDKYLISADSLFFNLKSLKDIDSSFTFLDDEQIRIIKDFWVNFNPDKPGIHKQSFIDIWSGLAEIYNSFKGRMLKEGQAYEGLIFRELVNMLKADNNFLPEFSHYYFVGFNALNKCEEFIFDYFRKQNIASFIWDYDELYIKNKFYEAGYFLRKNLTKLPAIKLKEEEKLFNNLNSPGRKIKVLALPSDISQSKIINYILENLPSGIDDSYDHTAIVLPDESLLMPVLSSVPEKINDINITMGYPIKDTSVYSYIEFLTNLNNNTKEKEDGECLYYHQDVLSILNHQYIISLVAEESRSIEESIRKSNRIYIQESDLQTTTLFEQIFNRRAAINNFTEYLMNILFNILEKDSENEEQNQRSVSFIEKEFIYKVYLTIKRLTGILKEQRTKLGFKVLIKVLLQAISSLRIPFEGEPLKGLQIMGLLETRLLDFENVIILSVNEGILPRKGHDSSYIPYNIRKAFELPVNENNDAIYAYYFYRLLQRVKNIYLVYNSAVTDKGISTGEQSRFISQLETESIFDIHKTNIGFDLSMNLPEKILVHKSQQITDRLNRFISDSGEEDFLSPSALNFYIDCSLKFYFRYIAGLKEAEEITEDIDSMLFGSIIHKSMEILYKKYIDEIITADIIHSILKSENIIDIAIKKAFSLVYFKSDGNHIPDLTGRISLVFEIIKKYVKLVLEFDKKNTPFRLLGLEENVKTKIQFSVKGSIKKVDIGGTIDRIDQYENTIRIIDYKTGKPTYTTPDLGTLFKKNTRNRNNAIFQILVYSGIYHDQHPDEKNICPSLFFIKDINTPAFNWHIKNQKKQVDNYYPLNDKFLEHLQSLVSEIFNPEIPFVQTTEEKICEYCPYAEICSRGKG